MPENYEINPQTMRDNFTDLNPYEVPKKFWDIISPYFEGKYKVSLAESFPMERVERPTIVWRTFSRTRFATKGSKGGRLDRTYHSVIDHTDQGELVVRGFQFQTVYYDWIVFATSPQEADQIAWDLENALIQTTNILASSFSGFDMWFERQLGDVNLLWRQQDELLVRHLRFIARVPIKTTQIIPELKMITIKQHYGTFRRSAELYTRDASAGLYFHVPLPSSQLVHRILLITIPTSGTYKPLVEDIDYSVLFGPYGDQYVKWNDEYGAPPAVGQEFLVDYLYHPLVTTTNI